MVEQSTGYALAIGEMAARHVGLKLEGAAPAALSFSDLAKDYDHAVPSDLSRIKRHEGAFNDREAKVWIMRYVVSRLNGCLAVNGNMVSFAPGKGFDDLVWQGEKVDRPGPPPGPLGRDAFSPIHGEFADNIRDVGDASELRELRESMKSWGWIAEFPALLDERGIVLVGNRRMKVAKELGITPVTKVLKLGFGEAADAERFKLAIASNIGSKKLSPNDRKRIAVYLYSEHEWSQQRIAEALTVSQAQVSNDLKELSVTNNSKRGRPKGSTQEKTLFESAAEQRRVTAEQEKAIADLTEQGLKRDEIAEKVGVGSMGVRLAQQRHLGRLEERAAQAEAKPHRCTCPHCGNMH